MSRRREREPPACVWVTPPAPDLECSVCSEVFTDPVTLACGHTFCRACALRWFTNSAKRCPVARCAASAGSKPATLPAAYALKGVVEALRVYCRFGVREDERGAWVADPEGCPAQLSRGDAAAHEAVCEHALEVCPFAGCGVERRRRDAEAHDAAAVVAHLRGERDARLALEASARGERDARLALEAGARAQQARLDALEARLGPVVPAAVGGSGAARAVTGAVHRGTLDGHTRVFACDWSPDGTMLVSGGADNLLKLWNVATRACTATLTGHDDDVWHCAFSPDGRTVASASEDKTLKLWDVATRTCVATLEHDNTVYECAWSPDGRLLASASTYHFKVWDVATRSCTATHDDASVSCAWSPDGRKVLIGGVSGTVTLWDAATRSCIATLEGHRNIVYGCAWCPDGRKCATASNDKTLKLWSAAAPFNCTTTLLGHTENVTSCAWSRDGLTIASGSHDETVKLWNAATGNCCATLECSSDIWKLHWNADDSALAVACGDGFLELYNVQRA